MSALGAPGDTWGIDQLAFVLGYVALAALLTVGAVVHRRAVVAGRPATPGGQFNAESAAYLNGGAWLTIAATLAGLRARGVVRSAGRPAGLQVVRSLPGGATLLEQAVFAAVADRLRPRELAQRQPVARALATVEDALDGAGLVVGRRARQRLVWGVVPLGGLAVVGLVRLGAGAAAGGVEWLTVAAVVAMLPVILVLAIAGERRTVAGAALLAGLREWHGALSPVWQPAEVTLNGPSAAMAVALYGPGHLARLDGDFAVAAELTEAWRPGGPADSRTGGQVYPTWGGGPTAGASGGGWGGGGGDGGGGG